MADPKITISVGEDDKPSGAGFFEKLIVTIVAGFMIFLLFQAWMINVKPCHDRGETINECYDLEDRAREREDYLRERERRRQ